MVFPLFDPHLVHGGVAEWFKVPAWKADVGQPTGGSNPPPSASFILEAERKLSGEASTKQGHGVAKLQKQTLAFEEFGNPLHDMPLLSYHDFTQPAAASTVSVVAGKLFTLP